MLLQEAPEALVIIGAGAIGVETGFEGVAQGEARGFDSAFFS